MVEDWNGKKYDLEKKIEIKSEKEKSYFFLSNICFKKKAMFIIFYMPPRGAWYLCNGQSNFSYGGQIFLADFWEKWGCLVYNKKKYVKSFRVAFGKLFLGEVYTFDNRFDLGAILH